MQVPERIRPCRRAFLGRGIAVGAALLPPLESFTQILNNPRRIDVHHHFVPPAYAEFTKANHQSLGPVFGDRGGPGNVPWDLTKDLSDMNKSGTAVAILSIAFPGFWFGRQDEVRKVVRHCNEYAAELRAGHVGRFGSFASIPLTDTDGSLREIEYALDTLKADGVGLFSNYRDKWLGHESFAPVYSELNRRHAIAYVHPITAACCGNLVPGVFDTVVEYGADTTRTIASLIYSGTTRRYPAIRWIFSHGGGVMPFVVERFLAGAQAEIVPGILTKGQDVSTPKNALPSALDELRRMYYDTAQVSNPVALGALRQVVPVPQILFGTDYPYRTAAESTRGLITSKVFDDDELRMIGRGNAERILPKYKN